MGVFYVDCSVENMGAPEKSARVEQLLVDTGSEYTWLPKDILANIGVDVRKPDRQFVMANGEVITRDVGYALLKVNGFETVDEVVFAEDGDLNLLGSRTLEGFGAIIDASRKQLVASGPHLAASILKK
ncbi:MAG TPA: retroviral-like aspartic protease family protein [Pyrinomonadaceae bacterium]|jgi:predicted aspartyl protease|nr:retroviral-like aspartic protease family protein [Pyrinomonadaceae bacterium]